MKPVKNEKIVHQQKQTTKFKTAALAWMLRGPHGPRGPHIRHPCLRL